MSVLHQADMTIYDAHLHLTREDLPRLTDWRAAGVVGLASATAHYIEWPEAIALANEHLPEIRVTLGIHPWYLEEASESALEELDTFLANCPALAIGEIGLDFADGRNDRERQLHWFEAQLALAEKHRRPAVLHLRRAWDCAPTILAKYPEVTTVLHSFNGSREVARQLLSTLHNCYFSFGFAVGTPSATRQTGAAQVIPANRLLVDSDYPFQRLPGAEESSPIDLNAIIKRLGELRQESPALLATQIMENWQRVFSP